MSLFVVLQSWLRSSVDIFGIVDNGISARTDPAMTCTVLALQFYVYSFTGMCKCQLKGREVMDEIMKELLGAYVDKIEPDLVKNLIRMPKAEIHVHLEGAIQPETVLKLAQRHEMLDSLPAVDAAGLRRWFVFRDFPHFIEVYFVISDLIRTSDDLALIVYDNGADMARQGIRYRELTFTPYSHTDLMQKGLTIDSRTWIAWGHSSR